MLWDELYGLRSEFALVARRFQETSDLDERVRLIELQRRLVTEFERLIVQRQFRTERDLTPKLP